MAQSRAQELFAARKFGMFIHWGLYSILGRGEWVLFNEKLPPKEYEALADQFTGEKFDADEIAQLAVDAGQKYIVFTTRHHDGFCLFDSDLSDYTTVKTAAKRDFVGELAEACRKHGLGFHPYYSLWDWWHPDFVPDDPKRWQRYLDYYHGQVREICTRYGPLAGMWFDPGGGVGPDYDFQKTAEIVHELQPDAAVMSWDYWVGEHTFSRLTRLDAHGKHMVMGDVAENLEPVTFEACETVNNSWGYNKKDHDYKSVVGLVQYLVDVVGRGGNLVLNIGPMPDGSLDPEAASRMRQIGRWLKENGEAIYDTRTVLHPRVNPEGYTTVKGDRAYFFLRNLAPLLDRISEVSDPLETDGGEGDVVFHGVRSKVKEVRALGKQETLKFEQDGTALRVTVPRKALRWKNFILDARTEGEAEVYGESRPQADGSLDLSAEWAAIFTTTVGEPGYYEDRKRIANWNNVNGRLVWLAQAKAGRYKVLMDYACDPSAVGSDYELHVGESVIKGTVPSTPSWMNFEVIELGEVDVPEGSLRVEMIPKKLRTYAFMDLRGIKLVPA